MTRAEHKAEAYRFFSSAEMYYEGDDERVTLLLAANFHATMALFEEPVPQGGYVRD